MVKPEQLKDLLHAAHLPRRDALALILASKGGQPVTTAEIQQIGKDNGIRDITTWNVTQYLSNNAGRFVRLPAGWTLGPKGKQETASLAAKLTGGQPAMANHALRVLLPKLTNADSRSFAEEAVICYETKCFRAAVVLSWVGAVSLLQDYVMNHKLVAFNSEAQRRNVKWKPISTKDGFGRMDEGEFLDLLADPAVGVLGKNVKEELKNQCLQLRNGCGHPNSLKIAEHRVASHLEVLILNVFTKF